VWCVTLSHTGKLNAMSRAMWRELRSVFEAFSSKTRCALRDVRARAGISAPAATSPNTRRFRFDASALRDFHEDDVWGGCRPCSCCDVPIVAHIEGNCMGAGVEIASCCDIRVAGASATFGAPIARWAFPWRRARRNWWRGAVGDADGARDAAGSSTCWMRRDAARGFLSRVTDADAGRRCPGRACASPRWPRCRAPEQTDVSGIEKLPSA
jgi:hypothetical protein